MMPSINLNGENPWKLAVGFVFLVFFFGIGLAHVVKPDYFIKRSGIRKGGEMLTEFNRLGIQITGILVAVFAVGILYDLCRDILAK